MSTLARTSAGQTAGHRWRAIARSDNLMDYVLATYALPRTSRTPQEWRRVTWLASTLCGRRDTTVPVHFLGLWDTVKVPGLPHVSTSDPPANVAAGGHAIAVDGAHGPFARPAAAKAESIEEVWFRGAHCDITDESGACRPVANITLNWTLVWADIAWLPTERGCLHHRRLWCTRGSPSRRRATKFCRDRPQNRPTGDGKVR